MKATNIIGVFIGLSGMVLSLLNTHLGYVEGDTASNLHRIFPRHDNVGNVFTLLSILFFALTAVCAGNWYKSSRS